MADGWRRCRECASFHAGEQCGRAYCMAVWLEMSDRDLWYYFHDRYSKKFLRGNMRPMVTFANNIACPKFKPGREQGGH
ncbi:MAG: hypothetical protein ACQXXL_03450 [Candidatus Methanosuratincola sp.]